VCRGVFRAKRETLETLKTLSAALLSEEAANQIVGGIVLLKGCQCYTPPADLFSHEWNFFSAWGMSVFGHYKKETYIEMGRDAPRLLGFSCNQKTAPSEFAAFAPCGSSEA